MEAIHSNQTGYNNDLYGSAARDTSASRAGSDTKPTAVHAPNEKPDKEELPLSVNAIKDGVEKVNKTIEKMNSIKLDFSVHEELKEVMIKVVDVNTKEVIREFPPEKLLDILSNIIKTAGLFVDKKI